MASYRHGRSRKVAKNQRNSGAEEKTMFGIIGAVLLLMWLLGFFAFHVTVGFIHILLVLAVISILYHFVAGRSALA
jgi:uncharacterized membrane protein YeaQ/YmgE (transglycosylase-associated protein family)